MGKRKRGEKRRDKFYHLSKKMGYRSRAAFSLVEIDSMFNFLHNARSVLDLGAAPGGWLQVAVRRAPVCSFILGVDLEPIRPIRGAHTIAADITKPGCRAAIKSLMDSNNVAIFDVVLHDGSPNVGSAWGNFPTMQSALVVDAMRLATNFLAPEGIFLTKVLRSKDYFALVYCLKQFFEKVDVTKPEVSRSTSSEIYVIGQGYKAPTTIDPRLLDVKHLFQASAEQSKVGKVSDFIWSDSSLEFLGSVNALSFEDSSSLFVKEHDLTTGEIKSLCEDLYVLDKNSLEHLLRWRMQIRKALEGNEDKRLLVEMEELTHALDRKKKKKAKKLLKQSCSLAAIKGKKVLQTSESDSDEDGELGRSESEAETHAAADSFSDLDSDEDQRRYDEILEEIYERYLNWKAQSTKQHKRAKQGLRIGDAELMENADNEDIAMDTESDQDQDDQLQLVKIHARRAKNAAKAKAWNKRAARRKMEKGR